MSVDVEGVEQLVVVVRHQVHCSGPGLYDADHLQPEEDTRGGSNTDLIQLSSVSIMGSDQM